MSTWEQLAEEERKVLRYMADMTPCWFDVYGFTFRALAAGTEVPRAVVPHVCRLLRVRGLAEFWGGLWTEDGEPAGAGYGITEAGRALVRQAVEAAEDAAS